MCSQRLWPWHACWLLVPDGLMCRFPQIWARNTPQSEKKQKRLVSWDLPQQDSKHCTRVLHKVAYFILTELALLPILLLCLLLLQYSTVYSYSSCSVHLCIVSHCCVFALVYYSDLCKAVLHHGPGETAFRSNVYELWMTIKTQFDLT